MSFTATVPSRCIERHPTRQTVVFAGVPINLSLIAYTYVPQLYMADVSRLFSGKKPVNECRLEFVRQVADALGMNLQAFIAEIEGVGGLKWTPPPTPTPSGNYTGAAAA